MKQGLLEQSKKFCSTAWKTGHKKQDKEIMNQADYCLEQIKKAFNERHEK